MQELLLSCLCETCRIAIPFAEKKNVKKMQPDLTASMSFALQATTGGCARSSLGLLAQQMATHFL
jgi:hypothetical protein